MPFLQKKQQKQSMQHKAAAFDIKHILGLLSLQALQSSFSEPVESQAKALSAGLGLVPLAAWPASLPVNCWPFLLALISRVFRSAVAALQLGPVDYGLESCSCLALQSGCTPNARVKAAVPTRGSYRALEPGSNSHRALDPLINLHPRVILKGPGISPVSLSLVMG